MAWCFAWRRGIPELLRKEAPLMAGAAPDHYDVFLSHSGSDKPAVEELARRLKRDGIEPFLDKWNLIPGDPWQEPLEEALDQQRRLCRLHRAGGLQPLAQRGDADRN